MPRIGSTLLVGVAVLVSAPSAHAATRQLTPAGADRGDCVSAPCASFAYAYGQAAAGDTVTVGAGVYGPQRVPAGEKAVLFQGQPGNKVRQLHVFAANTTYDGIDVDANMAKPEGGAAFEIRGVPNVTFRNGRVGNVTDEKGALLGGWESTASIGTVIDNVEFHDVIQVAPEVHNECIFSQAPGLTVRNSTFRNCATMDLMITRGDWWGQPPYGGVTLENNVFGHSVNGQDPNWHWYGLLLHGGMGQLTDFRIVNNTFENPVGGITTEEVKTASGVWANNIGGSWDCLPGVTYAGNVGKKCAASDVAVTPTSSCAPPTCSPAKTMPVGWADPARFDFRLTAGSVAIDVGSATHGTATDRNGCARGPKPDAGAYEFGATCAAAPPVTAPPPSGGTAAPALRVRVARFSPRTICRRARKGCPSRTTLRASVNRTAKVRVQVKRNRRTRTLHGRSVTIRAKGLKAGRHRVVLVATDAAGVRSTPVTVRLRVRR